MISIPKITDVNKPIFENSILPILDKKCNSCHNTSKSKGNLIMIDSTHILKGGKNGQIFIAGDVVQSTILQRVHLPSNDEKHMPPDGKPQLTKEEALFIKYWIKSGASFSRKINDLEASDSLRILTEEMISAPVILKTYKFNPASVVDIKKLNTPYRSVKTLSYNSPALEASYYLTSMFSTERLEELKIIKEQLIGLNLNNMSVEDKHMSFISSFASLEKLHLNGTKITDAGLKLLDKCQKLEQVSLANTSVTKNIELAFKSLKSLHKIFLDNTPIDAETIKAWQIKYPNISFFYTKTDAEVVELTTPILKNDHTVVNPGEDVILSHQIKGTKIMYTIDNTIPDSSNGIMYTKPIKIQGSMDLKAIAIKNGWKTSEVVTYNMFEKGTPPDFCNLKTKANEQYLGLGNKTFINGEKAPITNLKDQNWIAFREVPYSAEFIYKVPTKIKKISFCYGLQIPAYVFPPLWVKVYGGHSSHDMKLIKTVNITPFDLKSTDQVKSEVLHINLEGLALTHFRIDAQNVPKIPAQHPGKGEKAWLFIDEIFFYQ
ncbi:MAG: chitobiase/beta-hexosaminidase C-terminal domain-containing protein [Saprospiraceae bacterium]|nr:chitobiase/beta-hexosaminidase C-terminal domain-containing protein [Saprospiraceae bacterium]